MKKLVKADLHYHAPPHRKLRKGDFNRIVDLARQRLGAGGILALVSFDNYKPYDGVYNLSSGYKRQSFGNAFYVPERQILVVRGQEMHTNQGDILSLGLEKMLPFRMTHPPDFKDVARAIQQEGGTGVLVHGFCLQGAGRYVQKHLEILTDLDAIEIHNGRALSPGANRRARNFYYQVKQDSPYLGALANTDGHSFFEIGLSNTATQTPEIRTSETIRDSLRTSIRNATPEQTRRTLSVCGFFSHAITDIVVCKLWKGEVR